jgi:hypothetical protein
MFDPLSCDVKGMGFSIFVHDLERLLLKDTELCLLGETGDTFEYARFIQFVNKKMKKMMCACTKNLPDAA